MRGITTAAIDEVETAIVDGAAEGCAAGTWVRTSVPMGPGVTLSCALAVAHCAVEAPVRAWIVRPVGDGPAADVIAGVGHAPTQDQLDPPVYVLLDRPGTRRR